MSHKAIPIILVGAIFFLIGPFSVIVKTLSGEQVEIPFVLFNIVLWFGMTIPTVFLAQKWESKTSQQKFMHVIITCIIFFAMQSLTSLF